MNLLCDPFLHLDLDGLRLIEASAGTGKTFTLATLVTRLVIERGLRVGQILAVTFTDAATQELRERLRRRLALAARLAADATLAQDDADTETRLTRALIDARLQHESAAALRARLQRAAHEIDLAAVFTIHGFCARVLAEHALETGQAFVAPEMIGSDRELRDEVAIDLWRTLGAEPIAAELLQRQWPGPEALARDLGVLLQSSRLLPAMPPEMPDPSPDLQRAAACLRKAFLDHGDQARAQLEAAIAGKVLNGQSYKPTLPGELWAAFATWAAWSDDARSIDPRIDRLTPARLAERTNKGKQAGTPMSPVFDAVAAHLAGLQAREQWLAARAVALVHGVRDRAATRLAQLKRIRRVQTYDDLIAGVAAALAGAHGESLVENLRKQYAFVLVDEFQDTDPRQWAIFRRVFADRALFLIGDPKQAIYRFRGGDVHTYLAAARQAEPAPRLQHNYRSRPAVLRAITALYERAGADAFVDPRIRFHEVQAGAGRADGDFIRAGLPAPALTVRVLPPPQDDRNPQWSAPESRELATRACVAAIQDALRDAREDRALIDGARLRPGDIAVLVRTHDEAARVQIALSMAGIPAVAAGRQSLFSTEQAKELLTLFDALLQPGDDGRLRAALATPLLGLDAAAIERLDTAQDWHRDWQLRALAWRERWERHGPLALVADLCAENAPRLLGLVDGERRLTNLLQLAEALQEANARALGLHGLLDWLRMRIAEADDNDETQQLRLESDAHRVQILTLHKSKGLEFPLVLLPFAGIGKKPSERPYCEYPLDGERVLQFKAADGEPSWQHAVDASRREDAAEDARLLYVGLTRARHALWVTSGPLYLAQETPLARMLGDLRTLRTAVESDIAIEDGGMPSAHLVPLPAEAAANLPAARVVRRALSRDWWVYSFTQLAREAAGGADAIAHAGAITPATERAAEDEPEPAVPMGDARFGGSRFGNVLHEALEHVDFASWQGWYGEQAPPGQDSPLRAALRSGGYAEADIEDGLAQLASLVGQTLNVVLPEGVRLCEVPPAARRAEMEFHFALQPTAVDALLATLHAHGVLRERHAFGTRRRLEGLMTGKIDLVYAYAGRYYLLDYKSNRLPAYDAVGIERAMQDSEYTLQSLIYSLALHRWLRFRLGDAYDYERDFGGVRYLFCRGLDAAADGPPGVAASGAAYPDAAASGIYAHQPPRDLVDALDTLFAARGTDAA